MENVMIDGLKIEMTTEELSRRIAARILSHQAAAEKLEDERDRLEAGRDGPVPRRLVEHEIREHLEQAGMLTLLRDHLIPNEVYRLTELDLRFADLVVDVAYETFEPLEAGDRIGDSFAAG
jgi:hypothetical protein